MVINSKPSFTSQQAVFIFSSRQNVLNRILLRAANMNEIHADTLATSFIDLLSCVLLA